MKYAKKILSGLCITIILLSVVRVVVSNSMSTTGIDLDKTQQEIEKLKKENALLHEHVLKQSSLVALQEWAEENGFVPSKSTVVLSAPLPLALNQ